MAPGKRMAERAQGVRATISVVSHAQGELVGNLLGDIVRYCPDDVEVVVVVNVPEDERYLGVFPPDRLQVLRSTRPRGFGANHNAAARAARGRSLFVVNPDIRFHADPLPPLERHLSDARVGVVGPRVVSPAGALEETARSFPTASLLLGKALGRRKPAPVDGPGSVRVDWVAGMFLAIRKETFDAAGGFDEKFFLYYEDVDLCGRLRSKGFDVVWEPEATVCHDARRDSHRRMRYLRWHLSSAARYLARRAVGRYGQ